MQTVQFITIMCFRHQQLSESHTEIIYLTIFHPQKQFIGPKTDLIWQNMWFLGWNMTHDMFEMNLIHACESGRVWTHYSVFLCWLWLMFQWDDGLRASLCIRIKASPVFQRNLVWIWLNRCVSVKESKLHLVWWCWWRGLGLMKVCGTKCWTW